MERDLAGHHADEDDRVYSQVEDILDLLFGDRLFVHEQRVAAAEPGTARQRARWYSSLAPFTHALR